MKLPFARTHLSFMNLVLLGAPLNAAANEPTTDYVCTGASHIARVERVVQPNGIPKEMEKVTVTSKSDPATVLWTLWSHRDGENWSDRPLLDGTSRTGMRFSLRGFHSYLAAMNLDLPFPDGEQIVDVGSCWWVTNDDPSPACSSPARSSPAR